MNAAAGSALVIAADLSLGGTGLAVFRAGLADPVNPGPGWWHLAVSTVKAPPRDRTDQLVPMPARHETIIAPTFGLLDTYRQVPRLVVKEERLAAAGGRQPGSSASAQDLAGLHAVFEYGLYRRGVACLDVPAVKIKKYATGRHQAAKEDVRVAAAKRLEDLTECANNNESDALWLLVMTLAHYGLPLVQLPVAQQIALDQIAWPDLPDLALSLKGITAHGKGQHLSPVPQG